MLPPLLKLLSPGVRERYICLGASHKFATFYLYLPNCLKELYKERGDCFLKNQTILMVFSVDTFTAGVFNEDCFTTRVLFDLLANGKIYQFLKEAHKIVNTCHKQSKQEDLVANRTCVND